MAYQRIKLSTGADVGTAGALPAALLGLSDLTLANLPAAINPCPDEWADTGFLPVVDPPPPVPTEFYLSKVLFERRFTDAEFAAFDKVRLTIQGRPADWATNTAWTALKPFVRAFSDYDAAVTVNLLDPAFSQVMGGLQQAFQVFGSDAGAAQARIQALLTP